MIQLLVNKPDLVTTWRREINLSDRPTIIYVGRLIPAKMVDKLIKACSAAKVECELLIVGDGPQRSELEQLAADTFPRTRFLGQRRRKDLALAFANADLFVMPGSGGLAIHEAMIYGKPVVVGESDGTQMDLVNDGVNGFHLGSGEISELVRVIDKALTDPDQLERMGTESRRIATEVISLDTMTDGYVRALNIVSGNNHRDRVP